MLDSLSILVRNVTGNHIPPSQSATASIALPNHQTTVRNRGVIKESSARAKANTLNPIIWACSPPAAAIEAMLNRNERVSDQHLRSEKSV